MTEDVRLLTEIVESWAASIRARDIEGVLRHHDPALLMFDVVGPIQVRGIDAYKATWVEQFFPWHGGTGKFELRDLEIHAGESVAFATALLDCAGTEQGRAVSFTLRLTIGLRKQNGQWTIVHEHHSEPLR